MWTLDDYGKRATEIARAFCAAQDVGGNDLGSHVEKVARENALNPEQIRRLGRATNKAVFGEKYASSRGAPDRRVDFTPVDPEAVIERMQGATPAPPPPVTKTAAYPDLPDPRFRPREKTAAEVVDRYLLAPPNPVKRASHLQKIAQETPVELMRLNVRWKHKLAELAETCRGYRHDHDAFEKNALAVLGADVMPELNRVREELKLPLLSFNHEKLAFLVEERLLGTENELTRTLKEAMEVRSEYVRVQTRHAVVMQDLPTAQKEALRAR